MWQEPIWWRELVPEAPHIQMKAKRLCLFSGVATGTASSMVPHCCGSCYPKQPRLQVSLTEKEVSTQNPWHIFSIRLKRSSWEKMCGSVHITRFCLLQKDHWVSGPQMGALTVSHLCRFKFMSTLNLQTQPCFQMMNKLYFVFIYSANIPHKTTERLSWSPGTERSNSWCQAQSQQGLLQSQQGLNHRHMPGLNMHCEHKTCTAKATARNKEVVWQI